MLNNNKVNEMMVKGYNEAMYKLLEKANGGIMDKQWIDLIVELYYNTRNDIIVNKVYDVTERIDNTNTAVIEFTKDGKVYNHVIHPHRGKQICVYEVEDKNVEGLYALNLLPNTIEEANKAIQFNKGIPQQLKNVLYAIYNRKADNRLVFKLEEKKEEKQQPVKQNKVDVSNVLNINKNKNRYQGVDYMKNINKMYDPMLNDAVKFANQVDNETLNKLAKFENMTEENMTINDLKEMIKMIKEIKQQPEVYEIVMKHTGLDEEERKALEALLALADLEEKPKEEKQQPVKQNKVDVSNVLAQPVMKNNVKVNNNKNNVKLNYTERVMNRFKDVEDNEYEADAKANMMGLLNRIY